jgi:hypothetical protein
MTDFTESFKIIGAAAGVAAFVWNVWTPLRSYLVLTMEIRKPEGSEAIVKVSVANPGISAKLISYAALTVTPESSSVTHTLDDLLGPKSCANGGTSTFARLFREGGHESRYGTDCAILPLRELYHGQAMVGPGETVSYACSVNFANLKPETTYIIRFFVFILYAGFYLRWRFTADGVRYSVPKSNTT